MMTETHSTGWATATLWLLAAMAAAGSELLRFPEPGDGLLGDTGRFSRLAPADSPAAGPPGYARHLQTVQRHYLAVEGRHPPVYYFFCSVYYVPRESGFTEAAGFDTRQTRLGRRQVARDFRRAVRMEGTGRLNQPGPGGKNHISYLGEFRKHPLGNRNNPLIARRSAAVHRRNPLFRHGSRMQVLDPLVFQEFGATRFETADTGGGLVHSQIDLYWGEDDPLGPMEIYRPAGCRFGVRWIVPVIVSP
jgi:hypothetical protein